MEFADGQCDRVANEAEEQAEGVERIKPAVEPKQLVHVEASLQILSADTVMDTVQPSLQV